MTQGNPLSRVLYGLALVPLAEQLREACPGTIQAWYADNCAFVGSVTGIARAMRLLNQLGPARGYFPEPEKSILVARGEDSARAKEILAEFNFQHKEGSRYIGGFIGDDASLQLFLKGKVDGWVESVKIFARAARRYPQSAYAGLTKSLQMEWSYLQRVVPNAWTFFGPVEDAITSEFLPALVGSSIATSARELMGYPVRLAGIGISDPTTGNHQFGTLVKMTAPVAASLTEGAPLDASQYGRDASSVLRQEKAAREKELGEKLKVLLDSTSQRERCRISRERLTGAWLTAEPSTLNGTELSCDEFCDSLRNCLGLVPLNLPERCDGC